MFQFWRIEWGVLIITSCVYAFRPLRCCHVVFLFFFKTLFPVFVSRPFTSQPGFTRSLILWRLRWLFLNCSAYRKGNMQLATRDSVRQTNTLSAAKLPSVLGNTDADWSLGWLNKLSHPVPDFVQQLVCVWECVFVCVHLYKAKGPFIPFWTLGNLAVGHTWQLFRKPIH